MICAVLLLLLLIPLTATASSGVCGNGPRPQCAGTVGMTNYHQSMEPAQITALGCFEIPPEPHTITEAQDALIRTVVNSHPNGRCHLTVVSGLAAEMSIAEKDAVNVAIQAAKDAQNEIANEANDPQCSQATMAQIDNFFANQWDNPANTNDFLGDITALTGNTAPNIRAMTTNVVQRMLGIVKKVAKCNRAMGG